MGDEQAFALLACGGASTSCAVPSAWREFTWEDAWEEGGYAVKALLALREHSRQATLPRRPEMPPIGPVPPLDILRY